ncbi:MAG: nuclear transport factor 2 family protein [Novosphingobium sp.]
MSEDNKAVVRTFIEAFSSGDAALAETCLAPGAVTVAKGFGQLSGVRPREIVLATTASFKELIPTGLRPEFLSMTAEGERVVAEFEGNAVLVNGERYDNQYCMVFTLVDGRIVHVSEYYCTILADAKILPLLAAVEEQRQALARKGSAN